MKNYLSALLFIASIAFAGPGQIMQEIVNKVEANSSISALESTLEKHVYIDNIAAQVAGRSAWRSATKADRVNFIAWLKQNLLSYYADTISNLARYKYSLIARESAQRQVLRVQNPNGTSSDLVIFFKKVNGIWYIIDSSFNGISIVAQWKARLSNKIKTQGLSGVTHD